jgi:FtsZ-binding cell division protein ZapB
MRPFAATNKTLGDTVKKNNQDEKDAVLQGTEEAEILARLNERVEKAISMIQELRREREGLRSRVQQLESTLQQQTETNDRLSGVEEEAERFRQERGEIRGRIESILSSLETLDEELGDDTADSAEDA